LTDDLVVFSIGCRAISREIEQGNAKASIRIDRAVTGKMAKAVNTNLGRVLRSRKAMGTGKNLVNGTQALIADRRLFDPVCWLAFS
jgi:hypothetical protein